MANYIFIKLSPTFRFLPSDSAMQKQRVLPWRAAGKLQLTALSIHRPGKCWTFQEILSCFDQEPTEEHLSSNVNNVRKVAELEQVSYKLSSPFICYLQIS